MKRKKAKFHLALFLLLTFAGSFFTPVFAASPEAPVITADPLIITPGVSKPRNDPAACAAAEMRCQKPYETSMLS